MKENNSTKRIEVQGVSIPTTSLRPREIEEVELPRILSSIAEVGEIARKEYKDIHSVVINSPLFRIEGLVRNQLFQQKSDEKFGLDLDWLETPSDFQHFSLEVEHNVTCTKITFLFDFLRQIVTLSHYPESINDNELEKIKISLRALSILTTSQIHGRIKSNQHGFNSFAFFIWKELGASKKTTAKEFWDKCIEILSDEKEGVGFDFELKQRRNTFISRKNIAEKIDYYTVIIGQNTSGKQTLKVICESRDLPKESAKSFAQISKIWTELKNIFIEVHNKTK